MSLKRAVIGAMLCASVAMAGARVAAGPAAVDEKRLLAADQDPANWMTHGRDYAETRYSPLDQVNDKSVAGLKLAWYADLDTARGQEATPLVADGVLYTTSAWSKVFAYDAATGKPLWSYDPEVPGARGYQTCCDVVNRGVALWQGKVFVGTIDGRLIALDAATGKPAWSVQTTDTSRPYSITGAPRVVRGKVIIGNGGAELGVRGFVSAYDAATGKLVWRFYTAPNPDGKPDGQPSDAVFQKFAGATWGANGGWKEVGGGGTVWDAIVYDQKLDQILIGTGNGSPWNRRLRSGDEGDNLFLSSIVALNPDTGEYKWHYQEVPGEEWDFTATQPIMLADMEVNGVKRPVLYHAPKSGFFYIIDRETGKPVSATPFTPVNWASGYDEKTWRPIENPEARYTKTGKTFTAIPSAFGAHNWMPMATSPKTGLVYFPVQAVPFAYTDEPAFKYLSGGRWNLGNDAINQPGPPGRAGIRAFKALTKGETVAWDPVAKKARFTIPQATPGNGGVLATGGNLIFQGTPDGMFTAYTADTGRKLWQFDGQSGIAAGPMTFSVKGKQYVAVMAGLGGSFGLSAPLAPKVGSQPNGRVLVFALDGKAKLPPYERVLLPPVIVNEPASVATIEAGSKLYAANCQLCHGMSGYSNGVIPDLRRSQVLASKEAWHSVLLEGALEPRGMINFAGWLKPAEVDAIRAYMIRQAKTLRDEDAEDAKAAGKAAAGKAAGAKTARKG